MKRKTKLKRRAAGSSLLFDLSENADFQWIIAFVEDPI